MTIFSVYLVLGEGGGTQHEYIEATSEAHAFKQIKEYLDWDTYGGFSILQKEIKEVNDLPRWCPKVPNLYGVYR